MLILHRRGTFGQDYLTLRSSYFEGRPPKSVNMYFRRFALSKIPLGDEDEKVFDQWIRDRWTEKDELLEEYMCTGRFPGIVGEDGKAVEGYEATTGGMTTGGYFIETEMKPKHWWEVIGVGAGLGWLLMGIGAVAKVLRGGSTVERGLSEVAEETTALLSRPNGDVGAVADEL